jgi:hypothetical protein
MQSTSINTTLHHIVIKRVRPNGVSVRMFLS